MWLIYNLNDELVYVSKKQCKYIKNCLDYYKRRYGKCFFKDSILHTIEDKMGRLSYRLLYTSKYKIYYYYGGTL